MIDKWEKRARELCLEIFKDHATSIWNNEDRPSWEQKALQLGREMADARAEEIAKAIERQVSEDVCITGHHGQWHYGHVHGLRVAAAFARSMLSKKRTREDVLEEALRNFIAKHAGPCAPTPCAAIVADLIDGARRALEWREDDK